MTSIIKKFFKTALSRTDYRLVRKTTLDGYEGCVKALIDLYHVKNSNHITNEQHPSLECIIFSKDRALQLHALLSSYFEHVQDQVPIHILYRSSSAPHRKAYDEVFVLFNSGIQTVRRETDFREDLLGIMESMKSSKVMFLVDDILFINPIELGGFARLPSQIFVPSLRLGNQISFSYVYQKPLPLPIFIPDILDDNNKLCWIWEQGEMDWAFPLSLDGHIFSRQEIIIMIKNFGFSSPNSLERIMQQFEGIYKKRYGVCPLQSVIVNIPCNRVKADYDYHHGNIHQNFLLKKWEEGLQMNYEKLYHWNNQGVHEEIPIEFIPRKLSPVGH